MREENATGAVSHGVGWSEMGVGLESGANVRGRARPEPEPDRGRPPRRRGPFLSVVLECKSFLLACAEGDDAPDRIVRRNANGDPVTRHHLDTESPHAAAELSEHFVACVTLHAVKTAAVNRHHGALHVDEVVLAQTPAILSENDFRNAMHCATGEGESLIHAFRLTLTRPEPGS